MDFFLSVSGTSIKAAVEGQMFFSKGLMVRTSKERADSFTLKGVGNFYPKEGWELDPNKGWKFFTLKRVGNFTLTRVGKIKALKRAANNKTP